MPIPVPYTTPTHEHMVEETIVIMDSYCNLLLLYLVSLISIPYFKLRVLIQRIF